MRIYVWILDSADTRITSHTNANADTDHEISPNTKHHVFQYEYGYGYGIRMPAHSQANTDLTQNTDPTQYGA